MKKKLWLGAVFGILCMLVGCGKAEKDGAAAASKEHVFRSETITVEAAGLTEEQLTAAKQMPHSYECRYDGNTLTLLYSGGKHNLTRLLDYLHGEEVPIGRVYSQLPTLNDVFLEIMGKELRGL